MKSLAPMATDLQTQARTPLDMKSLAPMATDLQTQARTPLDMKSLAPMATDLQTQACNEEEPSKKSLGPPWGRPSPFSAVSSGARELTSCIDLYLCPLGVRGRRLVFQRPCVGPQLH
ncbi:unnamed protein product [Gadus morhua 'NCC']